MRKRISAWMNIPTFHAEGAAVTGLAALSAPDRRPSSLFVESDPSGPRRMPQYTVIWWPGSDHDTQAAPSVHRRVSFAGVAASGHDHVAARPVHRGGPGDSAAVRATLRGAERITPLVLHMATGADAATTNVHAQRITAAARHAALIAAGLRCLDAFRLSRQLDVLKAATSEGSADRRSGRASADTNGRSCHVDARLGGSRRASRSRISAVRGWPAPSVRSASR